MLYYYLKLCIVVTNNLWIYKFESNDQVCTFQNITEDDVKRLFLIEKPHFHKENIENKQTILILTNFIISYKHDSSEMSSRDLNHRSRPSSPDNKIVHLVMFT